VADAAFASALLSGLSQCRAVVTSDGGLLASLFLTGLVGGGTHCAGMCGPFVLSQVSARLERRPAACMKEWHRLTDAALIPYHIGRATTYAGLGAVLGSATGLVTAVSGLRWVSAALLVVAALLFVGYALPRLPLPVHLPGREGGGESWFSRHVAGLARPLFEAPVGRRGYTLGLLLGFIPCGLVYGALAAAASSGGALAGALGMLAFAAGTVPSLLGVGLLGHAAGRRWNTLVAQGGPVLLMLNAGILTWMAWTLVA